MILARKAGSLLLNRVRHRWRLARSSKDCSEGSIDNPRELSRLVKCGQASAGNVGQVGCVITVTVVGVGAGWTGARRRGWLRQWVRISRSRHCTYEPDNNPND